jgi:TRAP-type C4-dicarboxylate transport system permease small subunit
MTAVLHTIDRICLIAAAFAAILLAALFIMGFTEIILRNVFSISLPFAVEYAGYLLVFVLFLGSGWTLSQDGHIRVTLLSEHVAPSTAHRLDVACTIVALTVSFILTVSIIDYAIGTWARGTVSYFSSETPLVYPQALFAIGPVVLTLALIARLIRQFTNKDT